VIALAAVVGAVALVAGAPPAIRGEASTPAATPPSTAPAPASATTAPAAATTSPSSPPATRSSRGTARSAKKGVSTWDFTGVGTALRDVGAAWYYNWSAGPTAGAGTSAEFVPMIWGAGSVTAANLDRFLAGAAQRGLRVDFITVHWYGSDFGAAAVDHLRGYLQAIYDRYHKPIWLTEFALIKFTGSGPVYPSDSQQVAFIRGATVFRP
jgi:hypothetical protein